MFGFKKNRVVRITMFDEREVNLVSAIEGWGEFNRNIVVDKNHPLTIILSERRSYWSALIKCARYWRTGIDTCVLRN